MNEAAKEFERAVEAAHRNVGTRLCQVAILAALGYLIVRVLPWALSGFKIQGGL